MCCSLPKKGKATPEDHNRINYNKKDLTEFFKNFNECTGSKFTVIQVSNNDDVFNLRLKPGLNSTSMSINFGTPFPEDIDFGSSLSFRASVEAEFILPFRNGKWAVLLEPAYQFYKSENRTANQTITADFKSVELPVGVRHYFFLNKKSKIFVSGLFVTHLSWDAKVLFENPNDPIFYRSGTTIGLAEDNSIEILPRSYLAFGLGYDFDYKFNLELRRTLNTDLFESYFDWSTNYHTLSIILGISVF